MARKASDKASIMCNVTSTGLSPLTAYDGEVLSRYRPGTEVEVTLFEPKNEKLSRLFWSTLGRVVDNQDTFRSSEDLANYLKLRLNHFESVQLIGDGSHLVLRSLREFSHDEFEQFIERAWQIIAEDVIPGLDINALVKERRIAIGGDDGV